MPYVTCKGPFNISELNNELLREVFNQMYQDWIDHNRRLTRWMLRMEREQHPTRSRMLKRINRRLAS